LKPLKLEELNMNGMTQTQTQNENRLTRADAGSTRGYVVPPANIIAADNEYLIELEMPGVTKDRLEILVEGTELTVTGRRQEEIPEGALVYSESSLADFRRTFELSADVDTTKINAQMEQGVLKLHLPKREDFKPRKINISD